MSELLSSDECRSAKYIDLVSQSLVCVCGGEEELRKCQSVCVGKCYCVCVFVQGFMST